MFNPAPPSWPPSHHKRLACLKAREQLRLQEGAELGLALKEMKGAGLTVAANAYLYHHFDEF